MVYQKLQQSSLVYILLLIVAGPTLSLHVKGIWEPDKTFFLFISKFGFQKTDAGRQNHTQGYIFGNITTFSVSAKHVASLSNHHDIVIKEKREAVTDKSENVVMSEKVNTTNETLHKIIKKILPPNDTLRSNAKYDSNPQTYVPTKNVTSVPNFNLQDGENKSGMSNVTSSESEIPRVSPEATLVVLDISNFKDFYRVRNTHDKDQACKLMFENFSNVTYDSVCNPQGKEHFLRKIPCPQGHLCEDDRKMRNSTWPLVTGNQFTYAINDSTAEKYVPYYLLN